jgi:hypothetical protein
MISAGRTLLAQQRSHAAHRRIDVVEEALEARAQIV